MSMREIRYIVYYPHLLAKSGVPDEVKELICGFKIAANKIGSIELLATDGKYFFSVDRTGQEYRMEAIGKFSIRYIIFRPVIVHFHGGAMLRLLFRGMLYKILGARIYLTPCSQLSEDMKLTSWMKKSNRIEEKIRSVLIEVIRISWCLISSKTFCFSSHEAESSKVRIEKRVICPWPWPNTPISELARKCDQEQLILQDNLKRVDRGPYKLAFVGRFSKFQKGLDVLCEYSYQNRNEDIEILIFSPPIDVDARQDSHSAECCPNAIWDTTTYGESLYPYLLEVDAVVILSRWDGQPRALREAMLCGCYTIATSPCHFDDIHQLFGTGVTVKKHNQSSLRDAITQLRQLNRGNYVRNSMLGKIVFDPINIGRFTHQTILCDMGVATDDMPHSYYTWVQEQFNLSSNIAGNASS